ncbi:hypothetical protein JDW21_18815 [Bacillus subtilis]|uniref:hypothetical protein n=1 Tax=Bacillus subtilis TaxID=1423 RepID=UPI002ED473E9
MSEQYSSYDLVIGDLIKLNDDNIVWEVQEIKNLAIYLKNANKNDKRVSRVITTIDYFNTEPIKKWQEQLEEIGFKYLSE